MNMRLEKENAVECGWQARETIFLTLFFFRSVEYGKIRAEAKG